MAEKPSLGYNASAYAKHRQTTPQEITNKILHYLQEKIAPPFTKALDVGCGTGQGTTILSSHFQHVLGTDISEDQIAEARQSTKGVPNVTYSVSKAEEMALEDGTLQLITAAEAFHYFDQEKFYREAKRVLVPNGVVAIYGYRPPIVVADEKEKSQLLYKHFLKLYAGDLEAFSNPGKKLVDECYSSVHLPFSDTIRVIGIMSYKTCTVADYQDYLTTWSGVHQYGKDKGKEAADQLLKQFGKGILQILQSTKSAEETEIRVQTEYFLLLGRNC